MKRRVVAEHPPGTSLGLVVLAGVLGSTAAAGCGETRRAPDVPGSGDSGATGGAEVATPGVCSGDGTRCEPFAVEPFVPGPERTCVEVGRNADIAACPYCGADNTKWIADQVHPNALGYRHIAEKWIVALDRMLGGECAP